MLIPVTSTLTALKLLNSLLYTSLLMSSLPQSATHLLKSSTFHCFLPPPLLFFSLYFFLLHSSPIFSGRIHRIPLHLILPLPQLIYCTLLAVLPVSSCRFPSLSSHLFSSLCFTGYIFTSVPFFHVSPFAFLSTSCYHSIISFPVPCLPYCPFVFCPFLSPFPPSSFPSPASLR